jgi:DNA-binding NarL/FixJ family response regulator
MEAQLLADTLHRSRQFGTVAAASHSSEVLALVKEVSPDVLVVSSDFEGEPSGGIHLVREVVLARPQTKIVMLLQKSDRESVVQAFRSGCRGVFCRASSPRDLAKCVVAVHTGQVWANSEELIFVLDALRDLPPLRVVNSAGVSLLTRREMAVVQCAAEGLTNAEIGAQLKLSEHTVKNYMFRIFDKLGVSSRVELILYVMSQFQNHAEMSAFEQMARAQTAPPQNRTDAFPLNRAKQSVE